MVMDETDADNDLVQSMTEDERLKDELALLFGRETVETACQIDIADLNLNEKMTAVISAGVKNLKQLKRDPQAQLAFVNDMEQGARLLLCMWIMDMDLLDKIQDGPYTGVAG